MPLEYHTKQIADLEVIEVKGDPQKPTFILFHGWGANAMDLVPLCSVDRSANWLFPNAPIEFEVAPGYMGKAWFDLDRESLQKGVEQQSEQLVMKAFPEDFSASMIAVNHFLDELKIPPSNLILGGFSQGAIIATELALRAPENTRALVILSGILPPFSHWKELAPQHKGLPFFQCHGSADPIIPLNNAQGLEKLLLEAGLKGKLHIFRGGHEIPTAAIIELKRFLG